MNIFPKAARRAVAAAVLVALGTSSAIADATSDRIDALQAKFRCPIFEYLVAIHNTSTKLHDRYLVANIAPPSPAYYAQCIFYSKDRKMHCEAESQFYHPELATYFTPERVAALKLLGYSSKPSKNNFHVERKVAGIDSLYDIAGLYVDTLARIFDMQLDEHLVYQAPRVPVAPQPTEETAKYCNPQVSLR